MTGVQTCALPIFTLNHIEKTQKSLREIVRPAFYITENKGIDVLLREFQRKKVQMAVVISEFGGTLGIVTLEDILEELVGEIQDEHDQEQQIVTVIAGEHYQILARSPLHDINKLIEAPFPESEEYETLAGLLINTKSDLKEGDHFETAGYSIRIIRMNRMMPEVVEATRLTAG